MCKMFMLTHRHTELDSQTDRHTHTHTDREIETDSLFLISALVSSPFSAHPALHHHRL